MNLVKQALNKISPDIDMQDDETLHSAFSFPKDFPVFNGHFPGNKILPGFVQILTIVFLLEKHYHTFFHITEIIQSKFKSPILPQEALNVSIDISQLKSISQVNAIIKGSENLKCNLKIKFKSGNK